MNRPRETTPEGAETPRLLVVEDDAIVAREHRPDLVLMDIRLDGKMDGVEAGHAIMEELEIPLVYITAYADDETRSRVRETAPFGYVVKPFTERDLMTTVEVALLRYRMEEQLEAERAQVRRLKVDALKIDRTFVNGLPGDEKDRAIVETILTLGRTLKLEIVAEGIESEDQLLALKELGCDEAHGFFLARSRPLEDLREKLKERGS